MTQNDDLAAFVKEALARGVPRTDIEVALRQAGWSARQVSDAMASFADVPFAIPVPKPRSDMAARETFLYAVLFLALGLTAFHLGMLIFRFIEQAFPLGSDVIAFREAIRWPVAVLVVTVPVFLYVSRVVNRDVRLDPSRRTSKARSQMTYITLFICAAVVIGVLAGLVYSFLGGELTTRFILKSITAAAIAAGIFSYYLRDMRMEAAQAALPPAGAG